ncbi:MAG: DUF2812 domain-containing protein [Eubacteriales bacterium]|nr:DUF2812 domain-containing protein [Eubacteriales bacterium]MDD4476179.1 DUF2812 domain-containing protein [Eubacteriales bacterium]
MKKQFKTATRLFFDYDKQLQYINEMNSKGWKLVYIRLGLLYTFVKVKSEDYFTILHSTSKENISSLSTLAAQCGYENIPHTLDGDGDFLYLTGKKNEVSEMFVSDNESKTDLYKRIIKKYRGALLLCTIISSLFLTLFCIPLAPIIHIINNFDRIQVNEVFELKFGIAFIIMFGILGLITAFCSIRTFLLWIGYKKRYHALSKEMNVFE